MTPMKEPDASVARVSERAMYSSYSWGGWGWGVGGGQERVGLRG
jgi:hypothetical protein